MMYLIEDGVKYTVSDGKDAESEMTKETLERIKAKNEELIRSNDLRDWLKVRFIIATRVEL